MVLLSHCGFDTDWWHTNDWRALYEGVQPYRVILDMYGHTGTGLRSWAPPGEHKPIQCVNTGQTEKGFFIVQIRGERVRAAYRMKEWQEERQPDKKIKITWHGSWVWKHLLDKPL
ncbi:MAG: hypothetical protein NTW03_11580 [Verrucomicrobia bacterium]|nr:hypothetical protein [Verrucomicrobiota bacterium]